ncbi:BICD family-like cargo adapter 2 isoform X3 [Sinocyclocheilus rhinocerous]|uniref:BICD family-like cargo adapter 2 isoform X3 n=1 Tax=Sinocyclocheilus rhinocerous TaxID=307959 RepID=UPI0007B8EBA3|nr:PREDICTED: bicaudal D-related protein 2 isoform X3 [Sinocyclocheilus rhinocerous]
MFSSKKENLPSPILEDSFFSFSSSHSSSGHRIMAPIMGADDLLASPQDDSSPTLLEKDLILAAEVGQALLEKNEELAAQIEQMEREMEAMQQEKHMLQRRLDVRDLEAGQREAELQADITALRAQLEQKHVQSRDRRREESEQLTQLSNHNQKLVEQLAEAVALEHTLRTELRSLREEMEDTSFSKTISSARLDSLQAENRVMKERCTHMDERLKSTQEDNHRLRSERDGLRERVTEQQTSLKDKETEAKETILAHSAILQEKEEEIQRLQKELQSRETELEGLREEVKPFHNSPGKPTYSALEEEIILARQERDALNQQLLNTIRHKVALSQEVESWQPGQCSCLVFLRGGHASSDMSSGSTPTKRKGKRQRTDRPSKRHSHHQIIACTWGRWKERIFFFSVWGRLTGGQIRRDKKKREYSNERFLTFFLQM